MTMFGIEVEVENLPEPIEVKNYIHTVDGSLRNNGREYISGILSYEVVGKSFELLAKRLKAAGADFNKRCGVHIHIDFRGKGRKDIEDFLLRYLLIERKLVDICGKHRGSSNFCLPLLEADGDKDLIRRYLNNKVTVNHLERLSKYSALNLRPLSYQGSIEFRMLPSDGDVEKFLTVLEMLNYIAEYSPTIEQVAEKYGINTPEVLEALSFHQSIKVSGCKVKDKTKFLSKHFKVKRSENTEGGIPEETVLRYLEGMVNV